MGGETDYTEGSFLHGMENHRTDSELLENIEVENCDEMASPLGTPFQSTSERLARDSATQDALAEKSPVKNDSEAGESVSGENIEETDSVVPESEETAALRLEIAALDEFFFGSLEFPKALRPGPVGSSSRSLPRPAGEQEELYLQDNVALHPATRDDPIPGCLRLIRMGSGVSLKWDAYDAAQAQGGDSVRGQIEMLWDIPVVDLYSIQRYTPTLQYQYIIVALKTGWDTKRLVEYGVPPVVPGVALPPLYFHSGSVKTLLTTLQTHAALTPVRRQHNLFLINLVTDPLKKSLASLGLPEVSPRLLNSALFQSRRAEGSWVLVGDESDVSEDHTADVSEEAVGEAADEAPRGRTPEKVVQDTALSILAGFSQITRFARSTATTLVAELAEDLGVGRKRAEGAQVVTAVQSRIPGRAVRGESSVPARRKSATWTQGSGARVEEARDVQLTPVSERLTPLTAEEYGGYLDEEGRVKDPDAFKHRIFCGGLEADLRKEVWPILLGVYPLPSTVYEREQQRAENVRKYLELKAKWEAATPEQAEEAEYLDQLHAVQKDVGRTDPTMPFYSGEGNPNVQRLSSILTTYAFYNPVLGYCQGMCDLLSPLLFVVGEEADAFWCFAALMERVGLNFHPDQTGMQLQLHLTAKLVEVLDPPLSAYLRAQDCLNFFFCFRWIFLLFKREFAYSDVLMLWDVLFTRHLARHFHLYLVVAVLQRHGGRIMADKMDFEDILRYVSDLSGTIDLQCMLESAEVLCKKKSLLLLNSKK